jgi:hypothetical protein
VLGDQALELWHEIGAATQREVGLDSRLRGDEAQLLEATSLAFEAFGAGKLRVRTASPQPERALEQYRRPIPVASLCGASARRYLVTEAVRINRIRGDIEDVAGPSRAQQLRRAAASKNTSEVDDITLQRLGGRTRRPAVPHPFNQHVGRDHLAATCNQHRKEATLLGAAEVERTVFAVDLDWSEDQDLHTGNVHISGHRNTRLTNRPAA